MRSRLQPTELHEPTTGLPSLASLDHPTAIALIVGRLVCIVGAYDQGPSWTSLAGTDPETGRPVWASFEAVEPRLSARAGVRVILHDGPPDAPGTRALSGGGFVQDAISVFGRFTRTCERAVDVAEELLAVALRDAR